MSGAYTPQTEAISPTLPEPQEEAFKITKEDILKQITNIDVEIAKRESQIGKLQKKLKELEEVASQPLDTKRPVEEASLQPKHQTLVQKIYAENRVSLFVHVGTRCALPAKMTLSSCFHRKRRKKHTGFWIN